MVHIILALDCCFTSSMNWLSFLCCLFLFSIVNEHKTMSSSSCQWLFLLSQFFYNYCHVSAPNNPYSYTRTFHNGSIPHQIFCFYSSQFWSFCCQIFLRDVCILMFFSRRFSCIKVISNSSSRHKLLLGGWHQKGLQTCGMHGLTGKVHQKLGYFINDNNIHNIYATLHGQSWWHSRSQWLGLSWW